MEDKVLIQSINRMVELQEEILVHIKKWDKHPTSTHDILDPREDLLDSTEVKAILKISDSTMYRIKRSQLFQSVRIGKRDYYNMREIKRIVQHFLK